MMALLLGAECILACHFMICGEARLKNSGSRWRVWAFNARRVFDNTAATASPSEPVVAPFLPMGWLSFVANQVQFKQAHLYY